MSPGDLACPILFGSWVAMTLNWYFTFRRWRRTMAERDEARQLVLDLTELIDREVMGRPPPPSVN